MRMDLHLSGKAQQNVGTRTVPANDVDGRGVGIFTPPEWQRAVALLPPTVRLPIEMLVHTGIRPAELCEASHSDVREGGIVVRGGLSGPDRIVPLNPAADRLVSQASSPVSDAPLFSRDDGRPFTTDALRLAFARAVEGSGLSRRNLYSLRMTHAAWSLAIGIQPDAVCRNLGWVSRRWIRELYSRWVPESNHLEEIRAYFGLPGRPKT